MFLDMERLYPHEFSESHTCPDKVEIFKILRLFFREGAWYVELEREKDGVERWDLVSESLARELRKDDLSSFRLVDFACYNRLYKIKNDPPPKNGVHLNSSSPSK